LLICQSSRTARPSATLCDKKYTEKPEHVQVHASDEAGEKLKAFECDFIHIGFYSEAGCRIQLTCTHH